MIHPLIENADLGEICPRAVCKSIRVRMEIYRCQSGGENAKRLAAANPQKAQTTLGSRQDLSPQHLAASLLSSHLAHGLPHSDTRTQKVVASRIETGMAFIECPHVSYLDLPYGGIKRSGYGQELSNLGLEEFGNKKLILVPTALP